MAGNRVILIVLLLLGLSVAACGAVEQAGLGRSILLVRQASEGAGGPAAAALREAEGTLDGCYNLTAAAMYLGTAVAALAGTGLYLCVQAARRDGMP